MSNWSCVFAAWMGFMSFTFDRFCKVPQETEMGFSVYLLTSLLGCPISSRNTLQSMIKSSEFCDLLQDFMMFHLRIAKWHQNPANHQGFLKVHELLPHLWHFPESDQGFANFNQGFHKALTKLPWQVTIFFKVPCAFSPGFVQNIQHIQSIAASLGLLQVFKVS